MQELLGSSANLIGGERRIPINGVTIEPTPSQSSSSSSIPTSTTSSTTNTTKSTTTTSTTTSENLRCPRCDSSNTKFCYYNNYNLTQPRHFCKTCRRYWTKGGALRNVPIGGGCRKSKATCLPSSSSSTGTKSSATNHNNKMMKSMACEIGRSGFGLNGSFDHIYELPSSPVLWASPHQNNSHIFSLLRAGAMQNPNPNPTSLSNAFNEEGGKMGTHMVTEPIVPMAGLSRRAIDLDPLSQVPSLGLSNPTWRNSQHRNGGLVVDDQAQNSGLQQLYQRLRASTDHYSDGSSAILLSNVASSSVSTSSNAISESTPVVGGVDPSFWNPSFSWSDLPTTSNGAFHN